jgi:hypothetical protein
LKTGTTSIRQEAATMNNGTRPGSFLPLHRSLTLFLGLAAVIIGIIGMHILNVSHHTAGTGTVDHSVAAAAAPAHATHHAPGSDSVAASSSPASQAPHAAACAGPCGGDHETMTAVCMLMIVAGGFVLLFIPGQLRYRSRHGLRAPPQVLSLALPALRPPSLVQLSISRT